MIQQFHYWVYIQRNEIRVEAYLHSQVHCCSTHNSQEMKTKCPSTMNKENVDYIHDGIPSAMEKE
jgi:hypothetical protein